jgi:hypothetical protein
MINEADIVREVVELHVFFEDWFTGALPASDEAFRRFAGAMAEDFVIVSPRGTAVPREALLRGLYEMHGELPVEIRIDAARARTIAPGVWLASYEEWQRAGDGEWRGRHSTAVMTVDLAAPGDLRWRHVHETWLPDEPAVAP